LEGLGEASDHGEFVAHGVFVADGCGGAGVDFDDVFAVDCAVVPEGLELDPVGVDGDALAFDFGEGGECADREY